MSKVAKNNIFMSLSYACLTAAVLTSINYAAMAQESDWYSLFQANQFSDAEKSLDAALNADPNDANAHYYRAVCRSKRRECSGPADDFNWVMTHSADPTLRQNADKSLQAILHPQPVH